MKNINRWLLVTLLIVFSFGNVETMVPSYLTSQRSSFDMKRPLAEWPIVSRFGSDEEKNYYNNKTWDEKKSLLDNQKALVKKFVDECCNFSIKESEFVGIDFGGRKLFASGDAIQYKKQFIKIFETISKDPVGGEFLRVILAKINNDKDFLKKISFAPVSALSGNAAILDGSQAAMLKTEITFFGTLKCFVFTPDFWKEDEGVKIKRNGESNALTIKHMPLDAAVLHELIHSIHPTGGKKKLKNGKSLISERMPFPPLHPDMYSWMQERNLRQYGNDEEFCTMFGLTEKGWDPISESSYLAHRYGYMRIAHAVDMVFVSQMRDSGLFDEDLYNFYLSDEFKKRCPKFGIGDYKCKDLDPKTGEKLNSTQ
ncbi:MAG: hypothetical protein J6T29_04865 [Alphaproteobacteria bacterium]|nr:hypothetical protein [Alphaproteobacteria bacterium]